MNATKRSEAFAAARTRREKGIVDSILHAERNAPDWADRAFARLCQFAAIKRKPFTIEEFRWWAKDHGLDDPPDLRSFGGVTLRAIHRKVIERVGFAPTASSNGSCMALYQSPTKLDNA